MTEQKKNVSYILGVLLLSISLQMANYGLSVCVSGEVGRMGVSEFYILISSMSTLGTVLVLPMVGKVSAIFGLRNTILAGVAVQFIGRVAMISSSSWMIYAAANLFQAIGNGLYVSAPFVCMSAAVAPSERAKYYGFIPVANAIGAICGPLAVSWMYACGGILAKLAYVINIPFTLAALALIFRHCPNQKTPGAGKGCDFWGLILTVIGLSGLIFLLNLGGKVFAWLSLPALLLAIATVLSLGIMFRREMTIINPVVPIQMFRNKRLTTSFLCAMVAAAYSTCSASYAIMWIRTNFERFPASALFVGTAVLPQHLVVVILGMFLGGYISKRFTKRFRPFGIAAMVTAMTATAMLYCLRFTGTAMGENILTFGNFPAGMLLIWLAVAIGGFTSVVAQSTFSAFWQSNTAPEDIPSGQALYTFGSTGGSVFFSAICGVVMGSSGDYSRAFVVGFVFAVFGLIVAILGFKFSDKP